MRPRPGKEPSITPEAEAWLVSLACDKAKDHGYPHELWTTRLLARHASASTARRRGTKCLARLVQGTVCKILRPGGNQAAQGALLSGTSRCRVRAEDGRGSVRLSRGPGSEEGRRQVAQSHQASGDRFLRRKAGIQAIATTAPDLPPKPGVHATFARDYEYKRHGTLSLLAGIDLLTGKVHALVKDRHRSREFIEFLKCLDAAYPASTAIKLILDNHSAHISRETTAWLDARPPGRFEFTFTPKHGSWPQSHRGLLFSKFARSVLRHIRVTSKTRTQRAHYGRH